MKFAYKGRDVGGRPVAGGVEAPDRAAALAQLNQRGLLVSSLRGRWVSFSLGAAVTSGGAVRTGDLAAFCSQFATLLSAGVPVVQALEVLVRQFEGRRLARVLGEVLEAVRGGESLSDALRRHGRVLPGPMMYVTAVAEVSGRLEQGYTLLARQFEQEEQFLRKLRGALAYPAVVLTVAFATVLFMLAFVLPKYTAMFRQTGAALPGPTLILLAVAGFLARWWPLLCLGLLLVALLLRRQLREPAFREACQRLLLQLPLAGPLAYRRELLRLCRTLGTMVGSGVPLLTALDAARRAVALLPVSRALGAVRERVSEGESFGRALREQPVFDPMTVEMLAVGEASGSLEAMFFQVAGAAEREASSLLERAAALAEPVLTLLVGAVILAIIVPMLLPMFDLFSHIQYK